ncbi:GNAT family N-acetyltransferase [Pseudoalteromonas fenneropenaei]|uniref:GNAT family N-acetyltransferase n=1 Tax=Pseudoalteromonas fenneropenaei TaxID=1737459 RepID=A0ABV7CNZ4_9GAMM
MSKPLADLHFELLESEHSEVASALSQQLVAFNRAHWDVKTREPLGATYKNAQGQLIAGVSGYTFGNWLHIERLWVADSLRGQGLGAKLLASIEAAALQRGCQYALLDTLEFQAKDFYLRAGYEVQWVQQHYPKTGSKYFMSKTL